MTLAVSMFVLRALFFEPDEQQIESHMTNRTVKITVDSEAVWCRSLQKEAQWTKHSDGPPVQGKGKGRRLVVEAGRARGWDSDSYPRWQRSDGEITPLLLPWQSRSVRFRYHGGRLSPQ